MRTIWTFQYCTITICRLHCPPIRVLLSYLSKAIASRVGLKRMYVCMYVFMNNIHIDSKYNVIKLLEVVPTVK
jgi:hypothetical protein